ncbi:hypothetical protein NKJ90_30075 [Mesorhizobium sp. M0051]|uniref:hypothetical protein n=1 Tax=unclassified Mesorhizobium TaxID=325217 RepID=UPI0003CF2577|nr:hypothetical protein [Mesorhizobium sp. LNHC252B00]ESY72738.1 hypothetical protein X743_15670 [Mesorhizobium sp. LNHC252B00]
MSTLVINVDGTFYLASNRTQVLTFAAWVFTSLGVCKPLTLEEAPLQQQPDSVAARRLGILIEQYVEARKKRYDYVSTEHAYRAIRQVLKPAIPDRELDDMVASHAVKKGLAVVFDRQTKASADDIPPGIRS